MYFIRILLRCLHFISLILLLWTGTVDDMFSGFRKEWTRDEYVKRTNATLLLLVDMWRAEKGYLLPIMQKRTRRRMCTSHHIANVQAEAAASSVERECFVLGGEILRLLLLMMWTSSADVCGDDSNGGWSSSSQSVPPYSSSWWDDNSPESRWTPDQRK